MTRARAVVRICTVAVALAVCVLIASMAGATASTPLKVYAGLLVTMLGSVTMVAWSSWGERGASWRWLMISGATGLAVAAWASLVLHNAAAAAVAVPGALMMNGALSKRKATQVAAAPA